MQAQKKELLRKMLVITFLVLLVVGFTVPQFLFSNTNGNQPIETAEPRLCRTDADCYLVCGEKPTAVLCTENLCQQNSCEELSYYEFQENPVTFSLDVVVDGDKIDIASRLDPQAIFVKIVGGTIRLFSSRLTLQQVLEKMNLRLDTQCLSMGEISYCSDAEKTLTLRVNGEETVLDRYIPQEKDKIVLEYGEKSIS